MRCQRVRISRPYRLHTCTLAAHLVLVSSVVQELVADRALLQPELALRVRDPACTEQIQLVLGSQRRAVALCAQNDKPFDEVMIRTKPIARMAFAMNGRSNG